MQSGGIPSFFSFKDRYFLVFLFTCLVFVIFKAPYLSLPYFWDEAWSYIPAISDLCKLGPSLLPGTLSPEISRGHPLLFYFLGSLWMKTVGDTTISMHVFAMIISMSLLLVIYVAGRRIYNPVVAVFSVMMLCLQSMFLAQSSFVLPEIMLALWTLMSIYLFAARKYAVFVGVACLMLLTKETGMAVLFSIALWVTISAIRTGEIRKASYLKKMMVVFLPFTVVAVFFIFQYFAYGWFFFPEHMGMLHFEISTIRNILSIFDLQGKRVFTVLIIICLLILRLKGKTSAAAPEYEIQNNFTGISIFCFGSVLAFSALNYFSYRYLLCLFPIYFLLGSHVILDALPIRQWYTWVILAVPVYFFLNYDIRDTDPFDSNLSYVDGVGIQKDMTEFVEQSNLYDKKICTSFLFGVCLKEPAAKFRSTAIPFTNLTVNVSCEADYLVETSIEKTGAYSELSKQCRVVSVKRFVRGVAWAEIYKIIK